MATLPCMQAKAETLDVDDYRATPEGGRFQLVRGELIMAPAPSLYHQRIVWNLTQLFGRYLAEHPAGQVYFAPCDVHLSARDVVQPDLFFVSAQRAGLLADDGAHGAPDLIVEVLSPASAQLDKKIKLPLYAAAGVKELWLIDPLLLQIQIYDLKRDSAKPSQVVEEVGAFASVSLPDLTLSGTEVFRR